MSQNQGNQTPNWTVEKFEKAFRIHYHSMFVYAYGFVMDEMEADDIVQSSFLHIWEKREKLLSEQELKSYLFIAVKNGCLRYFRRLKLTDKFQRRQAEALVLSFGEELDIDVEDDTREKVRDALSKLSPRQALLLEMHVIYGMKYLDICRELGISENTVRTHLKRAYRTLRENLATIWLF